MPTSKPRVSAVLRARDYKAIKTLAKREDRSISYMVQKAILELLKRAKDHPND